MSIDWWMGRDDVVNIPTATSLGQQKRWNEAIYNDVGEVERTYAKWTQSVRVRQILNTLQLHSHVNFKKPNKLARGRWGDERSKQKNTLLTTENKLINTRGNWGGMGNLGMGIVEVTSDQYQALYSRVESLCGKSETVSYWVTKRNSSKTLK